LVWFVSNYEDKEESLLYDKNCLNEIMKSLNEVGSYDSLPETIKLLNVNSQNLTKVDLISENDIVVLVGKNKLNIKAKTVFKTNFPTLQLHNHKDFRDFHVFKKINAILKRNKLDTL